MNEKLEVIKSVSSMAAPFIKPIIDVWLRPRLEKIYSKMKTDKALLENAFDSKFEEYLARTYEKQSCINTIVFQNQQKRIDELYIPLTLTSSLDNKQFRIEKYEDNLIPTFKKILITDTAGMGKSTVIKWLFLSSTT